MKTRALDHTLGSLIKAEMNLLGYRGNFISVSLRNRGEKSRDWQEDDGMSEIPLNSC